MFRNIANKYFIHERLKEIPYVHTRARTLAYVYIFSIVLGVSMVAVSYFLAHNEIVPLMGASLLVSLLACYFKRTGNLLVSGNLLAGCYFFFLLSSVERTGGMYSDNLLWMLIAPLIALLFANRKSGVLWTVGLIIVTAYFYFYDLDQRQTGDFYDKLFETEYYLVSYTSLFVAVVLIVHLFEKGKEEIIDLLVDKNVELEENKIELNKRQNQLIAQKKKLIEQKKELEFMGQELISSNSDLQNFAQAASHDIKQPLRMMGSYLQLIKRDKNSNISEKSAGYMDYVIQSSDNLQQLLNGLLELSKVEKESSNHTEVSLNDIFIIVKNNLSQRIKETNAVVHCENLPDIYAPKSLIIQLFQNLIANGIKFQKEGTLPVITISSEKRDDEVIIQIKDNGIGIELDYQEKIFKIFERLHSQVEYEGSGIGLHTCKKIVQSLGKRIWLESVPGDGTTFYFTLPLYEKEATNEITGQNNYESIHK